MKTLVEVIFSTEAEGITARDLAEAFTDSGDQGEEQMIFARDREIPIFVESAKPLNGGHVYLRDLDGTGSLHPCSKGDPGAMPYKRARGPLPMSLAPEQEGLHIIAQCRTYLYKDDTWGEVEPVWKELWYHEGRWQVWCGGERVMSTNQPTPILWIPMP